MTAAREDRPSGKSRNFSIYLLKRGYHAENALKDEHLLGEPCMDVENLPEGGTFYLADNTPTTPWWKAYWGLNRELKQAQKGALIFLPVSERCVALTYGHTYHNIKNEAYEYDFGLRTTLNAIDPNQIMSTDVFRPEDAKRERIQSPTASDLTFFDINSDESIIKRLAGAVRSELQPYFRHVTGANNIRISSKVVASDVTKLCSKLIEIYEKDEFKTAFPDIQNITPIKDPSIILHLDALLLDAFHAKSIDLVFTIPDILDPEIDVRFSFSGAHGSHKSFDSVFIGNYRDYLNSCGIDTVEIAQLLHHKLSIQDENGNTKQNYPIYDCMLFDCEFDGNHYHLCDGNWYRIERNYIRKLKEFLDPYFVDYPGLQECNEKREDNYNKAAAESNADFVCLDKSNISPTAQKPVEPCDLYTITGDIANLIHIKISTRSVALSHLFNQGTNAVELLRLNEEARDRLKDLVKPMQQAPIDNAKFAVTYGIITAKNKEKKSDALPIFSRISLRRSIQALKLMAINCQVVLIKDNVDRRTETPAK